jgi:hypothetical protein
MSESLQHLLDVTLNQRELLRRQHEAELAARERATTRDTHRERERRHAEFQTKIRSLIQGAVDDANRHLATRPEGCRFCEMSVHFTRTWYPGHTICNPIAYELRVDGEKVGETLIIELTQAGMIEASLEPPGPSVIGAHTSRVELGFHPIPLFSFDAKNAKKLLVQFLRVIIKRWPIGQEKVVDPAQ